MRKIEKPLELNNELIITSGELNVNTPFVEDFTKISNIIIEQTPTITKRLSIYPKGCFLYFEQKSTSIKLRSNYKFQENDDGSYTLIEPW